MNINHNNKTSLSNINKPFIALVAIFLLISVLNIPILITLWRHGFDDGTYSHAFLIPFISLYLYYQLSLVGKLQFREKISIPFTLLLIACCYLLFITTNAQISIGYWLSFLLVCLASIPMIYRFSWQILFPTAFLIFIFPFWGILTPILQNTSVAAVTFIMNFTEVPTYVEGQLITIPAGVFEIAGGCSGLRYLIVSLAISSLFIFLYIKSTKRALMFFIVAILGALLTNWIRITALILIGEYSNMESSLMEDHNTFGWYLYIPFMFLLFRWGNNLTDNDLFDPKEKTKINWAEMPNKVVIVSLMIFLVLPSTTLKAALSSSVNNNVITKQISAIENDQGIKPKVHYYTSIEKVALTSNDAKGRYYIYHFDGSNLDGKPSFYGNNLIPEGWNVTGQLIKNNWTVYTLIKGNKTATVLVKYEIDQKTIAPLTRFKMERLMKAIKGVSNTRLHWQFQLN